MNLSGSLMIHTQIYSALVLTLAIAVCGRVIGSEQPNKWPVKSPVYKGVLNNWHGQDSQEHDMDPLDLDPPLTPENPFARSLPSENNPLARSLPNATPWKYEDVNKWSLSFEHCRGSSQSPVNIIPEMLMNKNYPPIVFGNYNNMMQQTIHNNGKKVKLDSKSTASVNRPNVSGGGLPAGIFFYEQMHFHWGLDSRRGSEHLIKSKSYPLEMHIVHYNSKYRKFEEAVKHKDGLAVLAVLIEETDKNNANFQPIIDSFKDVGEEGMTAQLHTAFPMMKILPNTDGFYRYSGSLTTPTCEESVTWTVFEQPLSISRQQMGAFRNLYNNNGNRLGNNFRPTQNLNGRQISYRFGGRRIVNRTPNKSG